MADVLSEVQSLYEKRKADIESFLAKTKTDTDDHVLGEMMFCLCTPQSKARAARALIDMLKREGKLWTVTLEELQNSYMEGIRFNDRKAAYIIEARSRFPEIKEKLKLPLNECREWLASKEGVKGIGIKEASHFLRNIGMTDVGIIDIHVQNFMKRAGLFAGEPGKIKRAQYLELEKSFFDMARRMRIPAEELDIAVWLYQSGEKEFYG